MMINNGLRKPKNTAKIFLILYVFISLLKPYHCWREWLYDTQYSDISVDDAMLKKAAWEAVWTDTPPAGATNPNGAPRPRRGHSLVKTVYDGDTYIVLFGGRDNHKQVEHIPRTYNVQKVTNISFICFMILIN
jgi:hypothetical protein